MKILKTVLNGIGVVLACAAIGIGVMLFQIITDWVLYYIHYICAIGLIIALVVAAVMGIAKWGINKAGYTIEKKK